MKTYIFIIAVIFTLFLLSCNDETKTIPDNTDDELENLESSNITYGTLFKADDNTIDVMIEKGNCVLVFFMKDTPATNDFRPIIKELVKAYKDIKFVEIEYFANQKSAEKYGVESCPTSIILKEGKVQETIVGATAKQELIEYLDQISKKK